MVPGQDIMLRQVRGKWCGTHVESKKTIAVRVELVVVEFNELLC